MNQKKDDFELNIKRNWIKNLAGEKMVDGHPWGRMTKIQDYCTPSKVIVRWFCEDFNLDRKWTYFEDFLKR